MVIDLRNEFVFANHLWFFNIESVSGKSIFELKVSLSPSLKFWTETRSNEETGIRILSGIVLFANANKWLDCNIQYSETISSHFERVFSGRFVHIWKACGFWFKPSWSLLVCMPLEKLNKFWGINERPNLNLCCWVFFPKRFGAMFFCHPQSFPLRT